jgi:hypothetical protein
LDTVKASAEPSDAAIVRELLTAAEVFARVKLVTPVTRMVAFGAVTTSVTLTFCELYPVAETATVPV